MSYIKQQYQKAIPTLKKKFKCRNILALPRFEKVVVNIGLGTYRKDKSKIDYIKKNLTLITGQKPVETRAKKAISGFSVRKGEVIGLKVTLRGKRMYDFLDRLFQIVLPRVRDFQGISEKAFDSKGNLTLGFKEQVAFPEISEDIGTTLGLEVTIVVKAQKREMAIALFRALKLPIKKF